MIPCHPTIGKVELVLKDVFKFSRVISTFPNDYEYSDISKFNIAKCIVLYLLADILGMLALYKFIISEEFLLSEKVTYALQIIPATMFYWIHLVWLIRNKSLFKALFDELKGIEYTLWKSGICWFYKPAWCTKYFCASALFLSNILWEIFGPYQYLEERAFNVIYAAVISVMNQYAILIQVLLSIIRKIRTIEESEAVIKLADKILNACQKVNTFYEPQILCYIFFFYLLVLFNMYGVTLGLETLSIIDVIWLTSFISPLLHILMCVGCFSQEVKKINKMLYRRLLYNLDDETLRFHLVAKRDFVFTAGGFFTFEYALLFTMTTTGMNYLVFFLKYM